jgi:formate-dependent nitrite reductase cytochrome c552 subunit
MIKGKLLCVAALFFLVNSAVAQKIAIRVEGMSIHRLNTMRLPHPNNWDNVSSGLTKVGTGTMVWLSGWDITGDSTYKAGTNYLWSMTSRPTGSTAALDSTTKQWTSFRPDKEGDYVIRLTIGAKDTTVTITAAKHTGVNWKNLSGAAMNCASCHTTAAPEALRNWRESGHATMFERGMSGRLGVQWGESCFRCHTTGYNKNALALNDGFDDVATSLRFVESEWKPWRTGLYDSLLTTDKRGLSLYATIGCESCHGPYNPQHLGKGTQPIPRDAGTCAQCHDNPPRYNLVAQWENTTKSGKVSSPANRRGYTGAAVVTAYSLNDCVRCHDGQAYVNFTEGRSFDNRAASGYSRLARTPITCVTCHEPHSAALRKAPAASDTLSTGYRYGGVNFGKGSLCIDCHKYRRYGDDQIFRNMSAFWGPHYGGAADVFLGQSAAGVSGFVSGHRLVDNTCVSCHMQPTPDTSSVARDKIGMHTWNIRYVAPDGKKYDTVEGCRSCHGNITTYDDIISSLDYDGNGRKEAFTTEVKNLLSRLGRALPPYGVEKVRTTDIDRTAIATSRDSVRLKTAFWNYLYVKNDGSYGIHNPTHVVNVLQQSLKLLGYSLTGADLVDPNLPREFELGQNYPNPFNPMTKISFAVPRESRVQLHVLDILGRTVATLVDEVLPAGRHTAVWNGRTSDGRLTASGLYFYRLKTEGYVATKKMLLLK